MQHKHLSNKYLKYKHDIFSHETTFLAFVAGFNQHSMENPFIITGRHLITQMFSEKTHPFPLECMAKVAAENFRPPIPNFQPHIQKTQPLVTHSEKQGLRVLEKITTFALDLTLF